MERSVEVLAVILFAILGVSHIPQPKVWAELFILPCDKGEAGVFVDGSLNLPLGGVIVGFHNTWSGILLVLTLVGWGLLIKGLIRFCAPKQALSMMARVSLERSWEFQVAGVGLVARPSWLWCLHWLASRRNQADSPKVYRDHVEQGMEHWRWCAC